MLTKRIEKKTKRELHKNDTSFLEQIQEATPKKQQVYGHLHPISKTTQMRGKIHAVHL